MASNSDRAYRRLLNDGDDDPLGGLTNLFDVVMVFVVALLVSLLAHTALLETLSHQTAEGMTNADRPSTGVALPETRRLQRFTVSENKLRGTGERLGVAYRLENGEVVYVPSARPTPEPGPNR